MKRRGHFAISSGAAGAAGTAYRHLRALFDGAPAAPLLMLSPTAAPAPPAGAQWDGVDVALPTSGSVSGTPSLVGLSVSALRASARATFERLHGPGAWLACLPIHHIAGFQVLARSALAGQPPVFAPGPLDPPTFAAAAARLPTHLPRYVSLVPTQLLALLDSPAACHLRHFDAILLGGTTIPAPLLARARHADLPVVTTYGMTETCGGCVYDGVALDSVQIAVVSGQVRIAGPVLATRVLGAATQPFLADPAAPGGRWLLTSDLGRLARGRLEVTGRADDVLISGGVNVPAHAVEEALAGLYSGQWAAVGVPDARWGTAVAVVTDTPATLEEVRAHLAGHPPAFRPRGLVRITREQWPLISIGKGDRRALTELARRARAAGKGEWRDA